MSIQPYDLIVIGAGTAGLTAIQEALDFSDAPRLALIEKSRLGGECANYACVPTKTMLTAAKYLCHLRELMPKYGIHAPQATFDFQALMEKKSAVVEQGNYSFLNDKRVSMLQGEARFVSPNSLQVNGGIIQGEKIIIASGARPKIPEINGLDLVSYWTSQEVTTMAELPDSVVLIGAGPVGVELAYMLAVFGCKVTLVETNTRLLKHEEPEVSQGVQKHLESLGIKIYVDCQVTHVSQLNPCHVLVEIQDSAGKNCDVKAGKIVMSTGVRPNVEGLCLDAAEVEYNPKGIVVDDHMRTTNPNVWAIGDVAGPYRFTHVGDKQAEIAVRNALQIQNSVINYSALNWAIFIEPGVAHVGLTEEQAKQQGKQVKSVFAYTEEVSRYRIESQPEGFMKLVIDEDGQEILGGHLFADHAEELAQTVTLAIQSHMTVDQLLTMFYIYPSRTQLFQRALEKYKRMESGKYMPQAAV